MMYVGILSIEIYLLRLFTVQDSNDFSHETSFEGIDQNIRKDYKPNVSERPTLVLINLSISYR